eukprot:TRINITY_DN23363_c0_g1_i1.p1 TRINITY_DN23363_c0_g1~~TRINITY_DN23363_c0_g1_i1.p1  ORF type:complete len:1001 (+),score=177.30 TRINITY_DN23363_c0_g1_i1:317-3004(+)
MVRPLRASSEAASSQESSLQSSNSDDAARKKNVLNITVAVCFGVVGLEAAYTGLQIAGLGRVPLNLAVHLCLSVFLMYVEFFVIKALMGKIAEQKGIKLAIHDHELIFEKQGSGMCSMCREQVGHKTGGFEVYSCPQCKTRGWSQGYKICITCFKKQQAKMDSGDSGGICRGDKGIKPEFQLTLRGYLLEATALSKDYRCEFCVAIVCIIITQMSILMMPNYQGNIINTLVDGQQDAFRHVILIFTVLSIVQALFNSLKGLTTGLVSQRIVISVQKRIYESLLLQDAAFYDATMIGQLTSRMTNDANSVTTPVNQLMNTVLANCITLVGGLVMCFRTSWKLTMLCFSMIGPVLYMTQAFAEWSADNQRQVWSMRANANSVATEALKNVRTVRIFNAEHVEINVFNLEITKCWKLMLKQSLIGAAVGTISGYVSLAVTVLLYVYGGWAVLTKSDDQLNIGNLVTFQSYWSMLSGSISAFNGMLNQLTVASAAAKRVFEIIHLKPDITYDDACAIKARNQAGGKGWNIEFKDITYFYQSRPEKNVFEKFSMTMPAGKTVALVGKSGMGKSTLISLLLRFYDPQEGNVLLDGKPLEQYNLRSYRAGIAVVAQETQIFRRSVKENLVYGLEEGSYDDQSVQEACKKANAHDFIMQLDGGYDAMMSEAGGNISGGQKQRLSIARAFVRRPKLLLLDEATSALDADNEAQIQANLEKLLKDMQGSCSVVLIAHRLSTVKNADKICLIDSGKVAEEGTHQELYDQGGIYSGLVKKQEMKSVSQDSAPKAPEGSEDLAEHLVINKGAQALKLVPEMQRRALLRKQTKALLRYVLKEFQASEVADAIAFCLQEAAGKIDLVDSEEGVVDTSGSEKSITELFEEMHLIRRAQKVRLSRTVSSSLS